MPTPKKKKAVEAGKVPDSHIKGGEAGFEPQAPADNLARQMPKQQQEAYCNSVMRMVPACELPHTMPPTPDEVMLADYPNVHNDIPGLLRAILRELVIMRMHR